MRWGKADYKQLQKLQENLQKLQDVDLDEFCEDMSRGIAARMLQLVIPVTPVGHYPKSSGKKGGTLRRGWTAKTEIEAANGSGDGRGKIAAHVASMPVFRQGHNFYVEVFNPVHYASYVEYGHRTPDGRGWVKGQLFMTNVKNKLENRVPTIVDKELTKFLKKAFEV